MLHQRASFEPYLSRKNWSAAQLKRVGFFDDGLTHDQLEQVVNDARWVTPIHHLKPCGVVLCTTGAFSPFHPGHLRMLEIAKAEIEERGWTVAGAFVQPDHDGYVSVKRGGVAACPASERVYQAQLALKDHPWIQVDPWAALYQDRPLNYTTILERTARLLGADYQVVYVFGSDNAGFREAFTHDEFVCVGRPGADDPHPDALDISSTQVRSEPALRLARRPSADLPYVIRLDLEWATEEWSPPTTVLVQFLKDLSAAFTAIWGVEPLWNYLDPKGPLIARGLPQPHISFDRVTGGPHWVSRVFDPCTLQAKPASWLSSDLSRIPAGSYALVDDDISTGSTVTYIKSQTPQVNWTKEVSLLGLSSPPVFDIVDGRDFLFGSRQGGLCVKAPDGSIVRVPYITPWVNLMSRAKIPAAAQPAFVHAVIEANVRFFEQVPLKMRNTFNRLFWKQLGYGLDSSMLSISRDLLRWTRS